MILAPPTDEQIDDIVTLDPGAASGAQAIRSARTIVKWRMVVEYGATSRNVTAAE